MKKNDKDEFGNWTLSTVQPVIFKIQIENKIFDVENKKILEFGSKGQHSRRIIVIDLKVSELYLPLISNYFKK